jgi:hypothetical protein
MASEQRGAIMIKMPASFERELGAKGKSRSFYIYDTIWAKALELGIVERRNQSNSLNKLLLEKIKKESRKGGTNA